jgi:hypothetical protein
MESFEAKICVLEQGSGAAAARLIVPIPLQEKRHITFH